MQDLGANQVLGSLLCKYCEVLEGPCIKPAITSQRFAFKNPNQRVTEGCGSLKKAHLSFPVVVIDKKVRV